MKMVDIFKNKNSAETRKITSENNLNYSKN